MKYNGFNQCLADIERRIVELESENPIQSSYDVYPFEPIMGGEDIDSTDSNVVEVDIEHSLKTLISDYTDSNMLAPIAYECLRFVGLSDSTIDKYLQDFGIEKGE